MPHLNRYLPLVPCAALSVFLVGTAAPARAQQIVAPNVLAAQSDVAPDSFPFFSSGMRYQEVYDSSQFGALTGPMLLTQIAFRPLPGNDPFSTTISDIQIDFSTTAVSSATLGSTFATNVGANDTVVFDGSLSLSSAGDPSASVPPPYDMVVLLSTPFLYDPSHGNLLMDVRNFSGEPDGAYFMDAAGGASATGSGGVNHEGVARVFSDDGSEAELTGHVDNGSINDAGVITQFTFRAPSAADAPEPGALALAMSAAPPFLAGALLRRRRLQR